MSPLSSFSVVPFAGSVSVASCGPYDCLLYLFVLCIHCLPEIWFFAAAAYHEGPCAAILTFTLTNNRASKSVTCGPPVDRSKSSSRTIMNPVTSFFAVKTPDYCPLVKGPSSLQ